MVVPSPSTARSRLPLSQCSLLTRPLPSPAGEFDRLSGAEKVAPPSSERANRMSPPCLPPPEKMISCHSTRIVPFESIAMRGSQENTFGVRETLTRAPAGLPSAENLRKKTSLLAWSTQATAAAPRSSSATVGSSTKSQLDSFIRHGPSSARAEATSRLPCQISAARASVAGPMLGCQLNVPSSACHGTSSAGRRPGAGLPVRDEHAAARLVSMGERAVRGGRDRDRQGREQTR